MSDLVGNISWNIPNEFFGKNYNVLRNVLRKLIRCSLYNVLKKTNLKSGKKSESAAELRSRRNPGSNQGPLDLQSNALPTELFRLTVSILSSIELG